MDTLGERALLLLLETRLAQLTEIRNDIQTALNETELMRVRPYRVWKEGTGMKFFPPDEDSPADQWEWKNEIAYPVLDDLDAHIEQMRSDIDSLKAA